MKKNLLAIAAIALAMLSFSLPAKADIIWNWSFLDEAGRFRTDGTGTSGGGAPAGTYKILEFSVTQSSLGMPLGSVADGTYTGRYDGFGSDDGFTWDGSTATQFTRANGNLTNGSDFFVAGGAKKGWYFAFYPGYFSVNCQPTCDSWGDLSRSVLAPQAPVPAPAPLALLGLGLAALGFARRKVV